MLYTAQGALSAGLLEAAACGCEMLELLGAVLYWLGLLFFLSGWWLLLGPASQRVLQHQFGIGLL